jgi:hypothetical protein
MATDRDQKGRRGYSAGSHQIVKLVQALKSSVAPADLIIELKYPPTVANSIIYAQQQGQCLSYVGFWGPLFVSESRQRT